MNLSLVGSLAALCTAMVFLGYAGQGAGEAIVPSPAAVAHERAPSSPDCNMNGIPDDLDVTTNTRASRLFFDDFEGSLDTKWRATGLWHIDEGDCLADSPPTQDPPTTKHAAYNRGKDYCDYDTGERTMGVLEMTTSVTLPALGGQLVWQNWVETEDIPRVDLWYVQVSDDGGTSWVTVFNGNGRSDPNWTEQSVDLYAYGGKKIMVRFVFDSRDSYSNAFRGWFIDDVAIYGYDAYSFDVNRNGIPDECEVDCNANGLPDDYDLAKGLSKDCNGNRVPDECDSSDLVTSASVKYEPFDVDNVPSPWVVAPSGPARSNVKLQLVGNGALGTAYPHRIDVYLNGSSLGSVAIRTGTTPCGSGMSQLFIDPRVFNMLTRSGSRNATFEFRPGSEITPRCESSYLQANLSYLTPNDTKDCNGNASPDECDLASGLSKDCNANNRPDECDIASGESDDCNANGIPDECDLAEGTSQDCNANGQPDECDLASGESYDCNTNGIPDECDLTSHTSYDCNTNGIPDECDVAERISNDCSKDGIPDECQISDDAAPCGGDLSATTIWFDGFEDLSALRWTTGTLAGKCTWVIPPPPERVNPHTGTGNAWGGRYGDVSDSVLVMKDFVEIPTSVPCYLQFWHAYDFENYPGIFDGGVVEYITDEPGTTWTDFGSLMEVNGYCGKLTAGYHNPLEGRRAFVCSSGGYIPTRVDLTSLGGKRIKIRFRAVTDWAGSSAGWSIDDVRISVCGFYTQEEKREDFAGSTSGWSEFSRIPGDGTHAHTSYDAPTGALQAWVSADPTRYRITGWWTDAPERIPYGVVGPNKFVRAKFYVYATGQTNPAQLNTIPNFRMRVSTRFAVNSMLEVNSHVNAAAGDEPVTLELRPSSQPTSPSLYRVDFDPVDVPQLTENPWTESILRGFEAYCLDPQDNGAVCLTESSIGVYPKSFVSPEKSALMWLKTYQPGVSTPGDFDLSNPDTSFEIVSLIVSAVPEGEFPPRDYDITPTLWATNQGLTLDSTDFDNYADGYRVGVVSVDLSAGPLAQRVRVEPDKQYMVKFHVVSNQQSNRNPQLRLRVRTARFGWVQKFEVGGAWAVATPEHAALAAQALPGIGCMNPEKIGTENGGWYTVLVHSPLDPEIRPEIEGSLAEKMPNFMAQPGPGSPLPSLRDLKVGIDLLDTLSSSVNRDLEAGRFTVDRIEVFSFNKIPD